jgi:L-fuconolactonase
MMVDAHHHFWKFDPVRESWITDDMQAIRRDFLPDDLKPVLAANGVDCCVTVQVGQSEQETEFMLGFAAEHAFIAGVVGWIDLRAKNLGERLEHFRSFPKLKGFRHIVQGEPAGFLLQKDFIEGVRLLQRYGFTYDLLVYHHQLPDALQFVREVPDVRIVVDHIAKPSIRTGEKTGWELNMAALATFKNVHCKLSGMVTEADWKNWKPEHFHPYLDEVVEAFGTDRLMYGSDWPVCLVAASYEQQLSIVQNYFATFSEAEKRSVMGENARRFYNL